MLGITGKSILTSMFNVTHQKGLTNNSALESAAGGSLSQSHNTIPFTLSRACVGIKVEPKGDEDWFCRACISRKQSDQTEGKKKKRKKKDKDKRGDH